MPLLCYSQRAGHPRQCPRQIANDVKRKQNITMGSIDASFIFWGAVVGAENLFIKFKGLAVLVQHMCNGKVR